MRRNHNNEERDLMSTSVIKFRLVLHNRHHLNASRNHENFSKVNFEIAFPEDR